MTGEVALTEMTFVPKKRRDGMIFRFVDDP